MSNQRHYDIITNTGNSEILKRHLSHYSYIALYAVVSLSLFKLLKNIAGHCEIAIIILLNFEL